MKDWKAYEDLDMWKKLTKKQEKELFKEDDWANWENEK